MNIELLHTSTDFKKMLFVSFFMCVYIVFRKKVVCYLFYVFTMGLKLALQQNTSNNVCLSWLDGPQLQILLHFSPKKTEGQN